MTTSRFLLVFMVMMVYLIVNMLFKAVQGYYCYANVILRLVQFFFAL